MNKSLFILFPVLLLQFNLKASNVETYESSYSSFESNSSTTHDGKTKKSYSVSRSSDNFSKTPEGTDGSHNKSAYVKINDGEKEQVFQAADSSKMIDYSWKPEEHPNLKDANPQVNIDNIEQALEIYNHVYLNLSGNKDVDDKTINQLCINKMLIKIETLDISRTNVTTEGIAEITKLINLYGNDKLKKIILGDLNTSPESKKALEEACSANSIEVIS